MKKRKSEHVVDEGTPERKKKAQDEKQSNHKSGEFARSLKGLLQKEHTRLSGLKKLQNALKESEAKESVGDIIKEGGEFQEIFTILERGQHALSKLEIQTCMEILESILLYTAEESQLANRLGVSIVQRVLQGHMKLLYSCLNPGNPPEVIKAALKLITAMVTQGSSAAREVQSSFDFTLKSLGALPNKRDSNSVQDVRTCFIYFCLSFLMFGDLAVMKQILEVKGFLQSVLKGLSLDKPEIVHIVLSTLQGRVVHNSGITKKTKVQFFNSHVLSQLANLYQYTKDTEENSSEEQTSDPTVRQKVHDLLLKVCGSFKFGICFSNVTGAFSTRSNNPVLLRFLQTLSSETTDVLVQELVITVLCCCHDVVRPFLSSLTATYEPRLSMQWIANMNLLTKVYIALPQPSLMVEKSGVKMTKETLPSLINMVAPVGISRTSLSRGVQHASYLVKHTTLSLVIVILDRAQDAVQCLASSDDTAEDLANTTDASLVQQFREEVVKALPDVNTFISLRQNLVSGKAKGDSQGEEMASPTILLAQSLKIIHGFQLLSPSLLSHINFDLKKLLSGQQETTLPVIAQQLTLQILLHAPYGSLKWFQQKGKSSTSFLYSILTLYTSARNENLKTDAQQLVQKLLSETGLLKGLPHANEVKVWLSHLCHSQFEGHMETLLRFLDEVFTAVVTEPYLYSDAVIDLQAEAVSHEASAVQFSLDLTEWTRSSDSSLPVSLLLVGALKRYCQMISDTTKPGEKAEALTLGCIAKYMNCVISDMIHSAMNSTILCFVVCHYIGGTEVPQHVAIVRSVHKALLHYLSYWVPSSDKLQDKIDFLKLPPKTSNNILKQLQSFLSRTTVHNEQEKSTVLAEMNRHLELLDGEQLGAVITDCVDFCKNQLSGQFSPLVQVLQVTNYRITGSSGTEDIVPLLQALPFGVLIWQVLGEAIQGVNKTANQCKTSSPDMSSSENKTSSPLDNSWIQSLLMKALEKEPLEKTIPLYCHVLMYLRTLKAKLIVIRTSSEHFLLHSALQLCFQLLQCLLQRLASLKHNLKESGTNALKETPNQEEIYFSFQSLAWPQHSCKPIRQGYFNIDIFQTVLHHPVIFECFLWKQEQSGQVLRNIGAQWTYNVANLLLTVLPSLTVQQKRILMAPFFSKICKEGMLEIESANNGNVISPSQALYLLGLFHEYCDEENQVKFMSRLSQLPSDVLITIDAVSREKLPSVFLTTLLTLLKGESCCEDHLSTLSSERNPFKTEEPLLLSHFKQLVKISGHVNCPHLDYTILKLLQKSLLYVMGSSATFLDICLDQSTKAKVAIAAHLVTHSPSLRSHFECRCLDKPVQRKKAKALGSTSTMIPVALKDRLVEFLPLVSSYLFCIRGIGREHLGNRTQEVVSHLVEVYWSPLWEWLVSDREGIFSDSEELCMDVLRALTVNMQDSNLLEKLNELLMRASLWDRYQQRICRQLVTSQYCNFSTNEHGVDIISKFCFACMEFLSINLIKTDTNRDNEQVIEESLDSMEWICEKAVRISIVDADCSTTWTNFVTNSLRYKFESSKVLRILSRTIKTIYKKQESRESLLSGPLSLDTLYEMVLSHSEFLDVILSTDKNMDTKELS
ncbi:uncharacterized protein LOC111335571 [Stylophora pistillata]|uniref:uncharacterized protein LOC111335571 n=1 Tax=Stylophora pistillata TaxID=50429 RepID=UPI000C0521A6|nr:uncharacterized protein LOC111335571 [Stylophora pistillata]